jgi:hypothetical protein
VARDHARIGTSIWREDSIRNLTRLQQQAYLLVLSQDDLSRCGVLAYRPRRWAQTSSDGTEKALRRDFAGLVQSRHVVIDEETEELFARTYVRHDRILAQPLVVAALVNDFPMIASPTIRLAFLREMRRLWSLLDLPEGERGGWLLAFGQYPQAAQRDTKPVWPHTQSPPALAKLEKAVKGGLLGPMVASICADEVEPFWEGSPEGIPQGFPEASARPSPRPTGDTHARAGAPTPTPSPTPAPSPIPLTAADAASSSLTDDESEAAVDVPRAARRLA